MASTKAIEDYRNGLAPFSEDIQNWLVDIYLEHGHQVNKRIQNILKITPEYFLALGDEDYQKITNDIIPPLIKSSKKLTYLNDYSEELLELIKQMRSKFIPLVTFEGVSDSFDNWIYETKDRYDVDLIAFAEAYLKWWNTQERHWEKRCRFSDSFLRGYDWRHTKNPFDINAGYLKFQNHPFIDGHKRDLEMLLIYVDSICPWFDWQKKALKDYIKKFLEKGESITYKEAAAHELGMRWKYLINEHPDDAQWKIWKDEFISGNIDGTMRTFLAFAGNEIVGDITLISENSELSALRINPEYQGRNIASGLINFVESWAAKNGFNHLQVRIAPIEVRNMQIFFHWGYSDFVSSDNNTLTYRKALKQDT